MNSQFSPDCKREVNISVPLLGDLTLTKALVTFVSGSSNCTFMVTSDPCITSTGVLSTNNTGGVVSSGMISSTVKSRGL